VDRRRWWRDPNGGHALFILLFLILFLISRGAEPAGGVKKIKNKNTTRRAADGLGFDHASAVVADGEGFEPSWVF
jgi:hypothetical protein